MKKNKEQRLKDANEFIAVIASCGRKFFEHGGFIATLELSPTGRVSFSDIDCIEVGYLGKTKKERGVICSSFNAG